MKILKKISYIVAITIITTVMSISISKGKTVEITTETLNLRKEPSTESNIVALISIGDECKVIDEEGDWYKVEYEEYTGYISKEYTKVVGEDLNSTDNNGVEEETNSEVVNNTNDTTVDEKEDEKTSNSIKEENMSNNVTEDIQSNKGKANKETDIKIVPLINGSNIGNLKKNDEVTIINTINGWTYIQTDTISGWVRSDNINSLEGISTSDDETVEENKKDNNTTSSKDDSSDDSNDSIFTEKKMYATDYINIRKEPSTSSDKLMVVSVNTELKVIGQTGDWYKVNTSLGDGYVSKELVSDKKITVTNRGAVDRTGDKTNEGEEETTSASNSSKKNETNNTSSVSEIVSYAKKFLGVPYVYGGASSSGFDCSGFTMYVYKHFGISMAHGAQSQSKLGKKVSADKTSKSSLLNNLKPGDLVFFLDYETMDEIGHCGIYIGDGNFIHASSGSGYCVKINSLLPGEYYNTRYCAARRII